jgi:uncharacterized membrane protein YccF (DUF307 family)
MISISRLVVGIFLITLGAVLVALSFLTLVTLIYAIPALAIGIVILFNSAEDKIEERKDLNKKESKK